MPRPGQHQDLVRPAPRLRRAYYDCRYGQLHLHNAIPGGGGFDELTPVLCLHDTGETGAVFAPLLAPLGEQRSVYALDLPGAGSSDAAPGDVAAIDAALHAVEDFLDSMRIRRFDLIARGAAATVALGLGERRGSALRRTVLIGAGTPVRASDGVIPLADAQAGPARIVELLAPAT